MLFFSGTDKPECVRHMTIDDHTRYYASSYSGSKCDSKLAEGWYRFLNDKSMATTYSGSSSSYCDTTYRGYLTGGHPSARDGRVTRKVCFYYHYGGSCYYSVYIKVRNCGLFYVYKLKPVPTCYARYCTN